MAQVPILVMSIDIGSGVNETLALYEHDIPLEVAKRFVHLHKLSPSMEKALLRQIELSIQQIISEERSASRSPLSSYRESNVLRNSNSSSSSKNIGEKLYSQGIAQKLQQERNRAMIYRNSQKEELNHPFKPSINQHSEDLAQQAFAKKKRTKRSRVLSETEHCTFNPKINEKSKLLSQPSVPSLCFEKLYADAKIREQKQLQKQEKDLKNRCSFQPEINPSEREAPEDCVTRLYKSRNSIELHLQSERSKASLLVDPETGQEFFKPMINNYCKKRRHSENVSHYQTSQPSLQQFSQELQGKTHSNKLIHKLKKKAIQDIFDVLQTNGYVMSDNMNIENLNPEVAKILEPLLREIMEIKEPVYFEDFAEALEAFEKALTPGDKNLLLFKQKEKVKEPENQRTHTPTPIDAVFKRNVEKQLKTQIRVQKQRESAQLRQLDGCTFKPKTTPYKRRSKK